MHNAIQFSHDSHTRRAMERAKIVAATTAAAFALVCEGPEAAKDDYIASQGIPRPYDGAVGDLLTALGVLSSVPPRFTKREWQRGHVARPRSSPVMLRWLQLLQAWTLSAAPISRPLAIQMLVRINLEPPTAETSSFLRERDDAGSVGGCLTKIEVARSEYDSRFSLAIPGIDSNFMNALLQRP